MPRANMEAGRERGRVINLRSATPTRTPASSRAAGRRTRGATSRSAGTLLAPHWPQGESAHPDSDGGHSGTAGALALLDQPETLPATRPVTTRRQILIVEDDAHMAGVMRAGLELEGEDGWTVRSASEGLRALELATLTPPDVVLLDVLLPGLDGAEVYRRLRANPKTRHARVLFISAGTAFDLHRLGIDDGVLLRKPFDVHELASLVRALLAG
jgi:CheY-like chemotaxis protein